MPEPVFVVPRVTALQYDGTNAQQIIDLIGPEQMPEIVSEADGTLVIRPGPPPYGTLTITTGQYALLVTAFGQTTPERVVDDLSGHIEITDGGV